MKEHKSTLKDNDLGDVNGGIEITALGVKETSFHKASKKKKKIINQMVEVGDVASLSFEEKLRAANNSFDTDASVGNTNKEATAVGPDAFKGRI